MSTNFDWNQFEDATPAPEAPQQQAFDWNQFEDVQMKAPPTPAQESIGKKAGRYLTQPVLGAAEFTTPGLLAGAWQLLGTGEALAEMQDWELGREEELRKKFPGAPWKEKKAFDKEKYMKALEAASKTVPTVSNIASFIEKQTGLPLEARTNLQRKLRLAGGAAKIRPGGIASKVTAGVVAPTVSAGLQKAKVPEAIADIAGLGIGAITPTPKFERIAKASGLPMRWYEKIKKPTKLSPKQYNMIKDAVEKDVKTLTDKLIKSESKTARAIEEFPDFNEKINTAFERVSSLAESVEEKVYSGKLKNTYRKRVTSREMKGISPDEFERNYLKESRKLYQTVPDTKQVTTKQLLEQYRKNNKSLGELYEPAKSTALNRAKKEALLDYNRAIAETFEKEYPKSEFNDLFKFANKRHMERLDLEAIDGFFDKVFGEKVNYKQARNFFGNTRIRNAFKRTLGKEGYKDMQLIMNDFMSTENAMKLIKKAESTGFKDMLRYAKKWALSPIFAKGIAIKDLALASKNKLLSQKQFRVTWKNALDDFKRGRFGKAQEGFKKLDTMEKAVKNS